MSDTTTKGHKEAVEAVTGNADPDEIVTTRDLASQQDKDAKLDAEAGGAAAPFTASLDGDEQPQVAVRTLPNGKTEALLEEAPAKPVFPPDDGGYDPEKRTFAGPEGTKVPSAVDKNQAPQDQGRWRDADYKKASKK